MTFIMFVFLRTLNILFWFYVYLFFSQDYEAYALSG